MSYYNNGAGDRWPQERPLEPRDAWARPRRPGAGRICERCGPRLDYGEICGCGEEDAG